MGSMLSRGNLKSLITTVCSSHVFYLLRDIMRYPFGSLLSFDMLHKMGQRMLRKTDFSKEQLILYVRSIMFLKVTIFLDILAHRQWLR